MEGWKNIGCFPSWVGIVGNYREFPYPKCFQYCVASWYFLSWQKFHFLGGVGILLWAIRCWLLALLLAPYPSLAFDEQCSKIKSPHIFTSLAFCPYHHSIFYTKKHLANNRTNTPSIWSAWNCFIFAATDLPLEVGNVWRDLCDLLFTLPLRWQSSRSRRCHLTSTTVRLRSGAIGRTKLLNHSIWSRKKRYKAH